MTANADEALIKRLDTAAQQLDEKGPSMKLPTRPTMAGRRQFPTGRRAKQHRLNRANASATPRQRREYTQKLERKAHRRFEVAVGLRKNTAPMAPPVKSEAASDVDAMMQYNKKASE